MCLFVRGQRSVLAPVLHLLLSAPPCIFFLLRSGLCLVFFFSSSSSSSPARCVFVFSSIPQFLCVFLYFCVFDSSICVSAEEEALNVTSVSSFRNYVFQKRYVKFDGKNLMYFGSEKVKSTSRVKRESISLKSNRSVKTFKTMIINL